MVWVALIGPDFPFLLVVTTNDGAAVFRLSLEGEVLSLAVPDGELAVTGVLEGPLEQRK